MVLGFKTEFSIVQAREWVHTYNVASEVFLTLIDELPNALFVVLFKVEDPKEAKRSLISASPLVAGGKFACQRLHHIL